jgi:hypothetical protein
MRPLSPHVLAQLVGFERKTSPLGRDRADQGRSGHDDAANSPAGALALAADGRHVLLVIPPAALARANIPDRHMLMRAAAGGLLLRR